MAAGSNGGAGINPLETPELLETLLSYVPPEDLKNARAVSKLWRDESLGTFRKSLVYVLDKATESKRLLKLSLGIQTKVEQHPTAFPLTIYRLRDKPLKKFRLVGQQEFPSTQLMESLKRKQYFWEQCAPHVTYLHLEDATFFIQYFMDGFIWLLKSCPKLEELKMDRMWAYWDHGISRGRDDAYNIIGLMGVRKDGFLYGPKPRISEKDLVKMRENPAPKIKSFSILVDIIEAPYWREQFGVVYAWRYLFTLMPGLKNLSIGGTQFYYVMDALIEGSVTTGQIIQLESFTFDNRRDVLYTGPTNFHFPPLLKYVEKFRDVGGSLKHLCLKKIAFICLRVYPKSFRNILFHTRKTIETINLGILHFMQNTPFRFDLFSINFPNLAELTLDFKFCSFSAPDPAHFFFDFNVFRGTPNLKRFRLKCMSKKPCLRKKLQPKDLEENGIRGKANWDDIFANSREFHEEPEIIDGDGTETFLLDAENEIILEKMKEFYFTGRFTTEALILLGKWMKNLKEFAAIFDEETLSIPFVVWPGTLKKLTVLEGSFKEGISAKLISNLLEMYPEIEIVLEGDTGLILDERRVIISQDRYGWDQDSDSDRDD